MKIRFTHANGRTEVHTLDSLKRNAEAWDSLLNSAQVADLERDLTQKKISGCLTGLNEGGKWELLES